MNPIYQSEENRDVPVARPGEFAPLAIGASLRVWPPVVLAPMAGVTNVAVPHAVPPLRRGALRVAR